MEHFTKLVNSYVDTTKSLEQIVYDVASFGDDDFFPAFREVVRTPGFGICMGNQIADSLAEPGSANPWGDIDPRTGGRTGLSIIVFGFANYVAETVEIKRQGRTQA